MADNEIVDVARAVQQALAHTGYQADLVELDPQHMDNLRGYDCIFNLSETIYGFPLTDYEITSRLEQAGLLFTGSGSATLRACLDKSATKRILLGNGITTPDYEVICPGQPVAARLAYPLFVKPVHEDASVGIDRDAVVHNAAELQHQVSKIHRVYSQPALVEQYIDGRDITAAILGNNSTAVVLPLSEIEYPARAGHKYLTFDAKWVDNSVDFQESPARCPCHLTPKQEQLIKEIALRAYHALGCLHYARVDFRLRGDQPYVLEVNPNPCLNPVDAGFIRAGKAAGYSYEALINKILTCAVEDRLRIINSGQIEWLEHWQVD